MPYPARLDPLRVFKIVDSGVTVRRAANTLGISEAHAYRILAKGEKLMGRKAKRVRAMRPCAAGGHNKGQKAKPRAGAYGETKAEALERLAPLLRQVTESWAAKARAA